MSSYLGRARRYQSDQVFCSANLVIEGKLGQIAYVKRKRKKQKTMLLSVIKEKLMINLSFVLNLC